MLLEHLLGVRQGDDVRVLVIAVHLRLAAGIEVLEAGRHDDRADGLGGLAGRPGQGDLEVPDRAAAGGHGRRAADLDRGVLDAGPEHVEGVLGRAHPGRQGGVVRLVGRAAEDVAALHQEGPAADRGDGPGRLQAGGPPADHQDR